MKNKKYIAGFTTHQDQEKSNEWKAAPPQNPLGTLCTYGYAISDMCNAHRHFSMKHQYHTAALRHVFPDDVFNYKDEHLMGTARQLKNHHRGGGHCSIEDTWTRTILSVKPLKLTNWTKRLLWPRLGGTHSITPATTLTQQGTIGLKVLLRPPENFEGSTLYNASNLWIPQPFIQQLCTQITIARSLINQKSDPIQLGEMKQCSHSITDIAHCHQWACYWPRRTSQKALYLGMHSLLWTYAIQRAINYSEGWQRTVPTCSDIIQRIFQAPAAIWPQEKRNS